MINKVSCCINNESDMVKYRHHKLNRKKGRTLKRLGEKSFRGGYAFYDEQYQFVLENTNISPMKDQVY